MPEQLHHLPKETLTANRVKTLQVNVAQRLRLQMCEMGLYTPLLPSEQRQREVASRTMLLHVVHLLSGADVIALATLAAAFLVSPAGVEIELDSWIRRQAFVEVPSNGHPH